MTDLIAILERLNWTTVFGGVLILGTVIVFAWMAYSKTSHFDFSEMFLGDDGRTSMAKFLAYLGGVGATWIVVRQTDDGTLSDLTFGAYLGTLVAGKVASEFVAARKVVDRDKVARGMADAPGAAAPQDVDLRLAVKTNSDGPPTPAPRFTHPAATERRPLGKTTGRAET